MGNLSKFFLILYLATSVLSPLVYSALASGPDRFEVQQASIEMISLSLLLISVIRYIGKIRLVPVSLLFYVPLTAFVALNVFLALSGPTGPQWAQTSVFFGIAVALVCGQVCGQSAKPRELMLVFKSTLWYAPLVIAALLIFLVFDRFTYPQGGAMKPVAYGGVVSTELSNIAGLAMIPYVVLFAGKRKRAACLLALSALAGVQIWLMSFGTIIMFVVIAGVVFLFFSRTPRRDLLITFVFAALLASLVAGVLFALSLLGVFDLEWAFGYTEDSYFLRLGTYAELTRHMRENPLVGIGLGRLSQPPHHNILGLAAETGIPSAALYIVASILGTVLAARLVGRQLRIGSERSDYAIVGVIFVLSAAFLQGKGFVHDTWYQKFMYFYLAFVFGAASNRFAHKRNWFSSPSGAASAATSSPFLPVREASRCAS
jgi:hypothetical protein